MNLDSAGVVVNKVTFLLGKSNLLMLKKNKEKNEHDVLEAWARTIGSFTQQSESLC
jgi:hypothetical protein